MVKRSLNLTSQTLGFGQKQLSLWTSHWVMESPYILHSNLQILIWGRRLHFLLRLKASSWRVGHNKAGFTALFLNIFPYFSNKKKTLSMVIGKWSYRMLAISTLLLSLFFFLLFKLLLFQLKRFMYFYFLTFAHTIPSLDSNLPLTQSSPLDWVLLSGPISSMKFFPMYQTSVISLYELYNSCCLPLHPDI